MNTNDSIKVSPEEQAGRERHFKDEELRNTLAEAVMEKWFEDADGGIDSDPEARTITIGLLNYGIETTYRYGIDRDGAIVLWNEEEGEEPPEELADAPDEE